jgi:hypothetical protein
LLLQPVSPAHPPQRTFGALTAKTTLSLLLPCCRLLWLLTATLQPAQRIFEPPKVPVFCLCEMPYNPDKFMVQCDQCTEW